MSNKPTDDMLLFHLLGTNLFPHRLEEQPDYEMSATIADRASFLRSSSIKAAQNYVQSVLRSTHISGKFIVNNSNVIHEFPYKYQRGFCTTHCETELESFYMSRGYFKTEVVDGTEVTEFIQLYKSRPTPNSAAKRYFKNPHEYEQAMGLPIEEVDDFDWLGSNTSHISNTKNPATTKATFKRNTGSQRVAKVSKDSWF